MEAVKRKRGRPPMMSAETASMWRTTWRDIHTSRQIQALAYAHKALAAIGRMPADLGEHALTSKTWLVDWAGANQGKQGAIKWCVLEELGRMLAADLDILSYVEVLETHDHGLTAKQATARLRHVRLTSFYQKEVDTVAISETSTNVDFLPTVMTGYRGQK